MARETWRRFRLLDGGVLILCIAIGLGAVAALWSPLIVPKVVPAEIAEQMGQWWQIRSLLPAIIMAAGVAMLLLGPIILLSQTLRGRRLGLYLGEQLWLIDSGLASLICLFAVTGLQRLAVLLLYGQVILQPLLGTVGVVSFLDPHQREGERVRPPWTSRLGSAFCVAVPSGFALWVFLGL